MSEPLRKSVHVRCSLEHAFRAFTSNLDMWWPVGHRGDESVTMILEAKVGGRFYEQRGDGTERDLGEVIRCEPPNRITYTWKPGSVSAPTEVDVRFTKAGDKTLVVVVHSEASSELGDLWPSRLNIFRRAWGDVLARYAEHLKLTSTNTGNVPK